MTEENEKNFQYETYQVCDFCGQDLTRIPWREHICGENTTINHKSRIPWRF